MKTGGKLLALGAVAVGAGFIVARSPFAFGGLGERVANLAAGLGPKRNEETALYYVEHLAPRVLGSEEARAALVASARRLPEAAIRSFGDRLAEEVRGLAENASEADKKAALARAWKGGNK